MTAHTAAGPGIEIVVIGGGYAGVLTANRRGRPAGDLAAVGEGGAGPGARPPRVRGPNDHPADAGPAAHAAAAPGGDVGPWLPEPLLTSSDVAEDAELAEGVSMALMLVLETLSPTESAVFVLREIFEFDYDEIAAAVDKSSSAVLLTDGGGVRQAALRPMVGPDKVVRFLRGSATKAPGPLSAEHATINGSPALFLYAGGELDGILALRVEHDRVTGLYYVRNPEKLSRLTAETPLSRR